jgi:hypothetical protein
MAPQSMTLRSPTAAASARGRPTVRNSSARFQEKLSAWSLSMTQDPVGPGALAL